MAKKTQTQPIKWKEAMKLLCLLRDEGTDNTRLMLACGFFMGLRIGDILKLTWEDIEGEDVYVQEQKTSKARHITFDPAFIKLRDQILDNHKGNQTGFIFVSQRKGAKEGVPISTVAANKRIKKAFEEQDIVCANPSSHTLRKTFGLRIYEVYNRCEDSLVLLSQIFNHQDISITRRYIGLTKRRISNAYLSLSSGKAIFDN